MRESEREREQHRERERKTWRERERERERVAYGTAILAFFEILQEDSRLSYLAGTVS